MLITDLPTEILQEVGKHLPIVSYYSWKCSSIYLNFHSPLLLTWEAYDTSFDSLQDHLKDLCIPELKYIDNDRFQWLILTSHQPALEILSNTLTLADSFKRILFKEACDKNYFKCAENLLLNSFTPQFTNRNLLLIEATIQNYPHIVNLLLKYTDVDPSVNHNEAIRHAARTGKDICLKYLLADHRVDPAIYGNQCLVSACIGGYEKCVKLLLLDSRVDPTFNNNEALQYACIYDKVHVVRLLLADPRVDFTINSILVLEYVCLRGYPDILARLVVHNRIDLFGYNSRFALLAEFAGNKECVDILLTHSHSRIPLDSKPPIPNINTISSTFINNKRYPKAKTTNVVPVTKQISIPIIQRETREIACTLMPIEIPKHFPILSTNHHFSWLSGQRKIDM
ncbi:hypothetical protein BC833DRAFT_622387 [Globomyces pollinis-pini]|nr:hypothetical protein BC833DRAFT_622387 [Globomyces pollinis-pini]